MLRAAIAFSLFHAVTAVAATDVSGLEQAKRIDADVETILHRTDTPGATIAVAVKDRIVYAHAYGFRDRERHIPATVDTHYEIGSITKQFTAAAMMQLQEAGKLRIDDTLATYLPKAPHAGEVTLRQMLSHTSGLPEYLEGPDIETAATKAATVDELMARIKDKPLDFAPGSRWSYSNTGYILLGRVIEVVSHETYRHYVQHHLLDPSGMTQTFTVADESRLPKMAVGYHHKDGKIERPAPISYTFGWSAGFLVSTVDDLEKWNLALTRGKIVAPASYALMSTSVQTTQHGDAEYGFGLFVDAIDGQLRIGHTGGAFGFTSANEYFPKQDARIIAFTNNGDTPEPGEMIATAIFENLYPEIAAAEMRPAPGEDAKTTSDAKAVFAHLQRGSEDSALFTAKLTEKMKAGLAARLATLFSPYGAPTAFIYKGERSDNGLKWSDYVIRFGPGSSLKFAIGLDETGKVASISYG